MNKNNSSDIKEKDMDENKMAPHLNITSQDIKDVWNTKDDDENENNEWDSYMKLLKEMGF